MKILMAGGGGFIGSTLLPFLLQGGHQISMILSPLRKHEAIPVSVEVLEGDILNPHIWPELVEKHQVIINLAGSTIFRRWNKRVKKDIYASRIRTTINIVDALKTCTSIHKHFFSASGVGYYGYRMNETLNEESGPGSSFLSRVAVEWESEALKARACGVRVILCRFGIVLGKNGGALKNMLPLFKYRCGGTWGSGRQWFSWIHAHDLARAVLFLIDHRQIEGAVNMTAPNPVTNDEMSRVLNAMLHRKPLVSAVPGYVLQALLGEFSDVFLKGQRVVPQKLLDGGFQFGHPFLEGCLSDLLGVTPRLNTVMSAGDTDVPVVRG